MDDTQRLIKKEASMDDVLVRCFGCKGIYKIKDLDDGGLCIECAISEYLE